MSDDRVYEIRWIGYNGSPNHNRVWGYLVMNDGRYFAFWGVKGKRLCFKKHHDYNIPYLISKQRDRGFVEMTVDEYEKLCPGFMNNLEIWFATAILADNLY